MSTFTLAISCLTPSNLPWFMDLTFQVPMQYCSCSIGLYFHQYSHINHWTLLLLSLRLFILSGVISLLISSGILGTSNLGSSLLIVLSFCLFILFMGFSRQEYWSDLPFLSPTDHILSELSTLTRPSWVDLHSMAHSFTELDKAMVHVIRLVRFLWL